MADREQDLDEPDRVVAQTIDEPEEVLFQLTVRGPLSDDLLNVTEFGLIGPGESDFIWLVRI